MKTWINSKHKNTYKERGDIDLVDEEGKILVFTYPTKQGWVLQIFSTDQVSPLIQQWEDKHFETLEILKIWVELAL